MLPDDVFRERLEQTLIELEAWAAEMRDCADIEISASEKYWRMSVQPHFPNACPFELLIHRNQTFDLALGGQHFENKPIERFDLFLKLVKAISAGRVDRIETRNTLTGVLIAIAMRVEITEGWDWLGHHTVLKRSLHALEQSEERQTFPFLPYRR
jgi:hypothetical protein